MPNLPVRKKLPHDVPGYIRSGAIWFLTINALPRGANHLCHPDIANEIWKSVRFNVERELWWPHLMILMPDHLHALLSFGDGASLHKTVSDWKHFLASKTGLRWQRDFFDHRLRGDESFELKAEYIRQNPVRKGLAKSIDEWPYVWTMEQNQLKTGSCGASSHGPENTL